MSTSLRAKKSQTEIMGLMIIVIILSLALLFVFKVVFLKKTTDVGQTYEVSKTPEAFVSTLLQTSSGCTSDSTIGTLLIDCAKNPFSHGTITCTDGRSSCEFANQTITLILQQTIDLWGYQSTGYEFVAIAPPNQEIVYYASGNLSASLSGETTPFVLRLYPSQEYLNIYLCLGGCGLS
ncbi:hypothetical protein HZA99_05475 [Candidatus Woesearchaeota archaeon]|nr:hypothetical protein [Candidatus Woesearchaeota archaeon]